jgi:hypothetical protein
MSQFLSQNYKPLDYYKNINYKLSNYDLNSYKLDYCNYNKLHFNGGLSLGLSDYQTYNLRGSDLKKLINLSGCDYICTTNTLTNTNTYTNTQDIPIKRKEFSEKSVQTDDLDIQEIIQIHEIKYTQEIDYIQEIIEQEEIIEQTQNNLKFSDKNKVQERFKEIEEKNKKMIGELDIVCDFTNQEEMVVKEEYLEITEILDTMENDDN